MAFDFEDLERTLPIKLGGTDHGSDAGRDGTGNRTPQSQKSSNDQGLELFAQLRGASASGSFAEATTWRKLDVELYAAMRGLPVQLQAELEEAHARRFNTARLEMGSQLSGSEERALVSVICPTTFRRRCFHSLLHECYASQTYNLKEIIIIETGGDAPSAFWLDKARRDPSIFYRHYAVAEEKWSVGLKRNLACCFASGRVIAHFDDDDLYAPCYLAMMVSRLVDPPCEEQVRDPSEDTVANGEAVIEALGGFAAGCAKLASWLKFSVPFNMWFTCDPAQDERVENSRDLEKCLYGWGFSFVYLRSAWIMCPFPHVQLGEDYIFLQSLRRVNFPVVLVRGAGKICAHTQHTKNTSGRLMELSEPVPMADAVLALSPLAPLLKIYRQTVEAACPRERPTKPKK